MATSSSRLETTISGFGSSGTFARKAEQMTMAVDQRAFQAKFVCRCDVGAQALPRMENPLTRNAERREALQFPWEMRPVRLVCTDALRCDDDVKAEIEIAARAL